MRAQTQKIAIASVGAALAAPCIILTNYVPLSVTLLTVACVCYCIVFDKAGIAFGFLTMAAASGLSFLGGVGMAQILNLILFVPYAVLAFFMRRFQFGVIKHMLIRAVIVAVFASLVLVPIFFLAGFLTGFDITGLIEAVGYPVVTILFALAFIAVDIMFAQICRTLSKRIKIGNSGGKK